MSACRKSRSAAARSTWSATASFYDAAVELIRIRGRKNPSKFLNDPISVNPQTSQLLHPPASLPPDPRKMALQARVKADQLAVAHRAQVGQQKAQASVIHQKLRAEAKIE